MEGVGDMSWDNSGDVVDIDKEECWRYNTPPFGIPLIFTLSLRCPSTFTRADRLGAPLGVILISILCRMHWIGRILLSQSFSFPVRHSLFIVRVVLVGLMSVCVFCNHSVLAKICYWLLSGPSVLYL